MHRKQGDWRGSFRAFSGMFGGRWIANSEAVEQQVEQFALRLEVAYPVEELPSHVCRAVAVAVIAHPTTPAQAGGLGFRPQALRTPRPSTPRNHAAGCHALER